MSLVDARVKPSSGAAPLIDARAKNYEDDDDQG